MKFYHSVGPNPRVVSMFLAEKGVALDTVEIDLRGGENRRSPYATDINPTGQTPALGLDDGTFLTEITVICEYLEELHPNPVLIGADARARAETRMWMRRIDLKVTEPMVAGFRWAEGIKLFESRMRCFPQAAGDMKTIAQDGLAWIETQLGEKTFIAGERFTLADILLFCFVDFGAGVGQPLKPEWTRLAAWYARVKARPSAAASAY